MIKAVYDTNVLVSGTVSTSSPSAFLIDAWISNVVTIITSEPLLDELTRTLTKPYFAEKLTNEQRQGIVNLVRSRAIIIPITTTIPNVATHSEDDIVLATAESGKANYIVTGDRGLQGVESFKGIDILNPRDFAELLQQKRAA
jgi:putative PIN family toxin of toxin-antitoxin system